MIKQAAEALLTHAHSLCRRLSRLCAPDQFQIASPRRELVTV